MTPLKKIRYRWKEYHEALGLRYIVDFSWETVQKEKPDLIHLLDFPYNGETTREQLLMGKLTDNKYHLCGAFFPLIVFSRLLLTNHYEISVRNHGGIPNIEEDAFELAIDGLVNKSVKLSLKDLKDASKFP